MDVGSLRSYVRNHLEMDDEELPDVLLNPYLQDAFTRTVSLDNRWPRYEKVWSVSKIPDADTVSLPADVLVSSIISVVMVDPVATGAFARLTYMSQENLEDLWTQNAALTTGVPVYWSVWGRELRLWPVPTSADLQVRGYRQPVWDDAASTIPDLDERLQFALAYYAMGLSYAAQEDEILEGVYMARWDRDVKAIMGAIMDPPRHRPLILNGGPAALGGNSYYIVPPAGT